MLELFRSPRRAIVWFVEASLLSLLAMGAAGLMLGWAQALGSGYFLRALLISLVAQASIYYHGLYRSEPIEPRTLVLGFGRALAAAAAALWLLFRLVPHAGVGRGVFVASLAGAAVVLPAWRAVFQRVARSEVFQSPALVLGASPLARACAERITADPALGLRLVGVLIDDEEPPAAGIAGRYADLARICAERAVAFIVIAAGERRGTLPVSTLLDLKLGGVTIVDGLDFYEHATGRIFVSALRPSDLLFAPDPRTARGALLVKRVFDVASSSLGLVLALPIVALAALAIRFDSPGPVLYSQVRTGARGQEYRIHKLRSMRVDAEAAGASWAAENDPRITRVGRFLRRSRIDEIPQLWNVLTGQMSLVGPRPERPVFVTELERRIPFYRHRLAVKPGVTGHAQVRCRYGASIEDAYEKLEYDLFYVKRWSLWFDLSILIDTVKVVLLRIGAR